MGCLMRDLSQFVREDGQFKALNELTPEQIQIIDTIVRNADGTMTYRIESPYKWAKMAAQHFSLLTERVEMVDPRHIEDKLIEARERAVKAGHAKKYPDRRLQQCYERVGNTYSMIHPEAEQKRKDGDRPDRVEGLIESRIQNRMPSRDIEL